MTIFIPTSVLFIKLTLYYILLYVNLQKINHKESVISINDLKTASEAFIASANRDLIPVVSIDNQLIGNGKIGPMYKKLMALYQEEISKTTILKVKLDLN